MINETMAELGMTLSSHGVKNEDRELINPFLRSENPLLDPSSVRFSSKVWLQSLISITSRDPERYLRRVAGVACKNLSAYRFGEPADYQKAFGNYPLKVLRCLNKLLGKAQKTRIQILRDFDGLVRSGEMVLVLWRPGRQVVL